MSDIPDQTIDEGASFTDIILDNYVSDLDNNITDLVWTYSGNTELVVSIIDRVATIAIPNLDWNGSELITFRATDLEGLWQEDSARFTVNPVNDAPVITEGTSTVVTMSRNGTPNSFNLTLHATDIDSATLTWSIATPASHGTASASGSGTSKVIDYTPTTNYVGADSFAVQVSDGNGGADTITVNVTINVDNVAPVITESDPANVNMSEDGSPLAFNLTLHATDVNVGDTLTWSLSATASHGTATASNTGNSVVVGYVPTADYNGTDSFEVQVSDGSLTDTITVNVTISAVNDVPVITEGTSTIVTMSEDATPTPFSLTLHATDIDSATLNWSISTPATHGTALASGSGSSMAIGYTPTADYNGSDSFVVQVSDGSLAASFTVNVTITPVNDAPIITEGASINVAMSEDGAPTPFSLTLNATDVDADTLNWSIATPATQGTATVTGTGSPMSIGYTPTANYNGTDSFAVQVSDGTLTATITVNVTISAVNDAPVITEGTSTLVTMSEDGSPTPFSLTLNATDIDSTTLTWSIATPALYGTASASGTANSVVVGYTPTANYNGTDSFVVQVADEALTGAITVNVTITPVNDAPVIIEGASTNVTMSEDGAPTPFSLTLNATNVDADTLTWSITTPALHGTATTSGTGDSKAIGYTPTLDYNGPDGFVVQVSDGSLTGAISVNVTITPVNDAPTDSHLSESDILETAPINTVVGTLSTIDPDSNDTFTYTLVSGTGSEDNSSFNISGDSLRTAVLQDFEKKSSYSIRIRSTDLGGLWSEKPFTITVIFVDTEKPQVSWISPAGDGQGYKVDSKYVLLFVSATDNVDIASVTFYRWDKVLFRFVDIGDVTGPLYTLNLDTTQLYYGWNEIDAQAYDPAGNKSERKYIFLYREGKYYLPIVSN